MFQSLNPFKSNPNPNNFINQPQSFAPQTPTQQYLPNLGDQTPKPQQGGGFLTKISSTTDSFIQFIKSKNPLSNQGLIEKTFANLEPINLSAFEELKSKNLKEIECGTITKGELNDITVISVIQNPRQVEKGFFEANYTIYDICTEQFKWLVTRRFSDFIWLRECLVAMFPAEVVPQVPKKKLGNRRFEKDFITKRQRSLQKFLDKVLEKEIFKSSEPVITFLSCSDRMMFEHQMKVLVPKVLAPKSLGGIRTFTGKIKVLDFEAGNSVNNNNLFNSINIFFKLQTDALNQLHTSLKSFHENMAASCASLEDVEQSFQKLSIINTRANFSQSILNGYEQYEIFFKNWKRILINQTCVIKEAVNNYFKNIANQSLTFSEILNQQELIRNDYINKKTKLMVKKESLWVGMDVSKWELNQMDQIDMVKIYRDKAYAQEKMCYKETAEINNLGNILGYYQARTSEQFWEIVEKFEQSMIFSQKDFSNLFEPSLTDMVNVWSNLASNIKMD